jgi:VanZ family protein
MFLKFLPGIAWFFVVLVLICLPGSDIPSVSWLNIIYFDKMVHAGIFGLLCLLFCWPFRYLSISNKERLHYFIKITLATIVWGLTTEFIQKYFVAGRQFDMFDWAADSMGALVAYIICRVKFVKHTRIDG